MIKWLPMAFLGSLISCLQGGELVLVGIEYAERGGPQGTYMLVQGKDGLVSLAAIDAAKELPNIKVGDIVPTLEKEYSYLAGKITVIEIAADSGKLAATGKVHVMGQVKKEGDQPADSLASCIATAEPTEFGAVRRIQVVRKGNRLLFDLRNPTHAETKLESGDIVHVPMKMIIGR
jgi:small ligand-binding sensory domain FIST